MTAGQTLDLEKLAQPCLREINLSVFKGVFVTAAHQERELIVICPKKLTEIEPVTLRFVIINHEAGGGGEVEQSVVTVHGVMKLPQFNFRHAIAFGPHPPDSWHSLERREGTTHPPSSPVGKAAQHRGGIPRMSMPIRKEPAVENKNAANLRSARCFTLLGPLKAASQVLQDDEGGEVEGDQRR